MPTNSFADDHSNLDISQLYSNVTYELLVTQRKPLLILGSKIQRPRSQGRIVYKLFADDNSSQNQGLFSNLTLLSPVTREKLLPILDSKGQGSRPKVVFKRTDYSSLNQ